MSDPSDILIFIHIPKAAGTSFNTLIEANFEPSSILRISTQLMLAHHQGDYARLMSFLPSEIIEKIKIFTGHFGFGLHRYLPQDRPTKYLTVLRDPIERTISEYYYVLKNKVDILHEIYSQKDIPFGKHITLPASWYLRNGQVRFLAGIEYVQPGCECTREHLEKAKENLQKCALVGITERFNETALLAKHILGWEKTLYYKLNVSEGRPNQNYIETEALKMIQEANALDIELYEFAKQIFESQLQKYPSIQNELPAYEEELRKHHAAQEHSIPNVPLLQEQNQHLQESNVELKKQVSNLNAQCQFFAERLSILEDRFTPPPPPPPPLPSIVFLTLPKSGTIYLSALFQKGLGLEPEHISQTYFMPDLLNWREFKNFMQTGNKISKCHIDPCSMNLQLLDAYGAHKMIVHVRDPRQATLSWLHFLNHWKKDNQLDHLLHVVPTPPTEYYDWELSKQIDWQLKNHYPNCIRWMELWLDTARKTSKFQIMFTTYEEFLQDNLAFINKVLDFYGIPRERFQNAEVPKTMDVNYRKGSIDEWRETFNQEQIRYANNLLSNDLISQFHWVR